MMRSTCFSLVAIVVLAMLAGCRTQRSVERHDTLTLSRLSSSSIEADVVTLLPRSLSLSLNSGREPLQANRTSTSGFDTIRHHIVAHQRDTTTQNSSFNHWTQVTKTNHEQLVLGENIVLRFIVCSIVLVSLLVILIFVRLISRA